MEPSSPPRSSRRRKGGKPNRGRGKKPPETPPSLKDPPLQRGPAAAALPSSEIANSDLNFRVDDSDDEEFPSMIPARFKATDAFRTWIPVLPTSLDALFQAIPLAPFIVENWMRKHPVLVGDGQPVDKILEKMNRHKISSLPVINDQGLSIGVVDSMLIVKFLAETLKHEELAVARWTFNLKGTFELLKDPACQPPFIVSINATLFEALVELSKGRRKLVVLNGNCEPHEQTGPEEDLIGFFTASDFIRFMGTFPYWLGLSPKAQSTLKDLGLVDDREELVQTIEQNQLTKEVFLKLAEKDARCIAIVNAEGRLITTLEASHIRGISRKNFDLLKSPIFEYIQRDRRRGWWSIPPCLREFDTLEKAVLQFASTQTHQMFILDDLGRPKSLVSLIEIIRLFL